MKYKHTEYFHNLASPKEIVPEIMKLLNPNSVVDVGCGIGTFVHCFKEEGVLDVLGIDGPWADKKLLEKHLNKEEFLEKDLEKEFSLPRKFELVVSLEVAEHLAEKSADIFVKNLVSLGDVILFSAAVPLQGGQNHINEQWLDYWEDKFNKHEYYMHDIMRPIFWDNPNVFWWYKQNMVLFTSKDYKLPEVVEHNVLKNVIHYDLYTERVEYLKNKLIQRNEDIKKINQGKSGSFTYIKLFIKSIIGIKVIDKIKLILKQK